MWGWDCLGLAVRDPVVLHSACAAAHHRIGRGEGGAEYLLLPRVWWVTGCALNMRCISTSQTRFPRATTTNGDIQYKYKEEGCRLSSAETASGTARPTLYRAELFVPTCRDRRDAW